MKRFSRVFRQIALYGGLASLIAVYLLSLNSCTPTEKAAPYIGDLTLFALDHDIPSSFYDEVAFHTGIHVIPRIFKNRDEMITAIKAGEPFDIGLTTHILIKPLSMGGYLEHIDTSQMPNEQNIDHRFSRLEFDRGSHYSIPFFWGSWGIIYNCNEVEEMPLSWANLLESDKISYLGGHISMVDDARISIGTALIYLGFSPNTKNPAEIQQAVDLLKKQRPYIEGNHGIREVFHSGYPPVFITMARGGEAVKVSRHDIKFRYCLPDEGVLFFVDCFVISKKSEKHALAYKWLNYLLLPKVSAEVSNLTCYAVSNKAARPYVNRLLLMGPSYIDPMSEKQLRMLQYVDDETNAYYAKKWKEVLQVPSEGKNDIIDYTIEPPQAALK